ncbi:MAG: hypothetical protein QMC21_03485 [Flavobacteriales bacterium]
MAPLDGVLITLIPEFELTDDNSYSASIDGTALNVYVYPDIF